jgi:hypothetical protein
MIGENRKKVKRPCKLELWPVTITRRAGKKFELYFTPLGTVHWYRSLPKFFPKKLAASITS